MDDDRTRAAILAGVTALVVTASLVPIPVTSDQAYPTDALPPWTDKLAHAAGYAAWAYALAATRRARSVGALAGVVVAAALLGAGVELAQAAVPGRDPSALDAAANAAGALVGAAWLHRRRRPGSADDAAVAGADEPSE